LAPERLLRKLCLDAPTVNYEGPNAARDSRELMSEIVAKLPQSGDVLDLGCGPRDQSVPLAHLGHRYVGVDYSNPAADLLADAHALPFADESFHCVLSYAVLEHLQNPFVALHEIARVMRPGGCFIGTVSQGEPFHSSYFHHTPWALISLVSAVPGLRISRMWPSTDTLGSLASMGRYSQVLKFMLRTLDLMNAHLPWLTPRKMRWHETEKQLDRLYRAGSICFAIEKSTIADVRFAPETAPEGVS
jgi:SAM-dependent methyltransferase